MFGMTVLTPEEKKEHIRVKRIQKLHKLIMEESLVRRTSLTKAEAYTEELDILNKG
jgi:hypothetical protein|tara:strand:+ start:425 stop:592 length:168 start_codon:yes stop_codon:yes gene_type:complete